MYLVQVYRFPSFLQNMLINKCPKSLIFHRFFFSLINSQICFNIAPVKKVSIFFLAIVIVNGIFKKPKQKSLHILCL